MYLRSQRTRLCSEGGQGLASQAPMKIIAHRGSMQREMQNSPAGVRLAAQHRADFVELDIARNQDGSFHCAHGLGKPSALRDYLVEIPDEMGLIAHVKGRYEAADLLRLKDAVTRHLPLTRVIFASHRTSVLVELKRVVPEAQLARFGLFPAIAALWKQQPWQYCLINQSVLLKAHVRRLQQRGYAVFASCVWELRNRRSVQRLGADGAFLNLREVPESGPAA